MSDQIEQTFVYEDLEVRKTGRVAKKTLTSGKVQILEEITPTNSLAGSWKKWVNPDQLFIIE